MPTEINHPSMQGEPRCDEAMPHMDRPVRLSIVVPALNEQDNVTPLIEQVGQAMQRDSINFELIIVDDGSTDQTLERLQTLQTDRPWLRVLHRPAPRGQSAAFSTAGIGSAPSTSVVSSARPPAGSPSDSVR